jgi:hypothetical protein
MKFAFILIISQILFTNCELSADNVVLAINCGGESFKDSKGIIYEKVFDY